MSWRGNGVFRATDGAAVLIVAVPDRGEVAVICYGDDRAAMVRESAEVVAEYIMACGALVRT